MGTTIESALAQFLGRVSGLVVDGPHRFPITALRERAAAAHTLWGAEAGVYFFEQSGQVQYVGRALPGTGLRTRVLNQCTAFGDARWDTVIRDAATTVGVVVVPHAEWYWAAALEPFLIRECAPRFNKRSC